MEQNFLDLRQLETLLFPIQTSGQFDIRTVFSSVFSIVILIAAIIAIFYLVWAGIRYIMASTDPEEAQKARTAIFNAIIGIIVIILSYAIIVWVANLVREQAVRVQPSGTAPGAVVPQTGGINGAFPGTR